MIQRLPFRIHESSTTWFQRVDLWDHRLLKFDRERSPTWIPIVEDSFQSSSRRDFDHYSSRLKLGEKNSVEILRVNSESKSTAFGGDWVGLGAGGDRFDDDRRSILGWGRANLALGYWWNELQRRVRNFLRWWASGSGWTCQNIRQVCRCAWPWYFHGEAYQTIDAVAERF